MTDQDQLCEVLMLHSTSTCKLNLPLARRGSGYLPERAAVSLLNIRSTANNNKHDSPVTMGNTH
jgi:hypothetical protein